MNKKEFTKFDKEAAKILLAKGFKPVDYRLENVQRYELDSPQYGRYSCHIDPDYKSGVLSLFGRFEDAKRAEPILREWGGNTFSGKLNLHDSEARNLLLRLEYFTNEL